MLVATLGEAVFFAIMNACTKKYYLDLWYTLPQNTINQINVHYNSSQSIPQPPMSMLNMSLVVAMVSVNGSGVCLVVVHLLW